jgi:glucokinase
MPRPSRAARSPKSRSRTLPSGPVLGIDLGATKVVAGFVDRNGTIIGHSGRIVHTNDGPGGVIDAVARIARACVGDLRPPGLRVGIAVAAQVEPRTGTVVQGPNLGWRNVPLARRLQEALAAPVSVIHDARAATLAKWRHGT